MWDGPGCPQRAITANCRGPGHLVIQISSFHLEHMSSHCAAAPSMWQV